MKGSIVLVLRFVLVAISFVATASATVGDWPQWRGPNRDGLVPDATIPRTWPKALRQEWKITVGVGHSSPVVSNNRIYMFARQGEDEVLLCLDASTGREIWRSSQPVAYQMNPAASGHGKGPKSTPIVSNGTVCAFGITGVLSCYATNTGTLKWRREFSKLYQNTSPLYGTAMSPVVENGLLIAHVGGHDKGAITAFDLETGAIKWSQEGDGPAYSSPIVVTLAGTRQVVTFTQKEFVGIDAATGKLLWKIPARTQYDTNSVTAVAYKDLLIFAREDQGLTAIRLSSEGGALIPKEVWSNKDNELRLNTPVLQGNLLFGLSVRQRGQFFAIDADTGRTIWQSPGRMGENAAIVNLGGKVLLLLTNEAKLIVQPVTAQGYAPVVEYSVANSPTWAHPVVLGSRVLIKDETALISLAAN